MSASSSDGRRTAAAAVRLEGAGKGCMCFGVQDKEVEKVDAAVEWSTQGVKQGVDCDDAN